MIPFVKLTTKEMLRLPVEEYANYLVRQNDYLERELTAANARLEEAEEVIQVSLRIAINNNVCDFDRLYAVRLKLESYQS
jgi:hypothetical protein